MENKPILFSLTKKDFEIEFFCAGGHGGQNMQKNATACRITHPPSKAVGISRDERSQLQNKKKAFDRLYKSKEFQKWFKIKCAEANGVIINIEQKVDNWMKKEDLQIEYF